jgi:hypothetical protein
VGIVMSGWVKDRLEGNPEALASRERYREIVKAMGEEAGRFVARFEIKLTGNGECTIIATSSRGAECDMALCETAIAMIQGLTGVQAKDAPPDCASNGEVKL